MIRVADENDAAGVHAIYAPIVRDTAISFEVSPPSSAEIQQRMRRVLTRYPWLVCGNPGEVLGYSYASSHRERAAYAWSVDVAVYVHERARGYGVGRALYAALTSILGMQGFSTAFAGVTLPNPASVALHEAVGFLPVGTYRSVGWKLGMWHDVGWWCRPLHPASSPPTPVREFASIRTGSECKAELEAAAQRLSPELGELRLD